MTDLAYILQGEAGICPLMALIAVAYVYQVNPTMYGYQTPGKVAMYASLHWSEYDNPMPGATYVFNQNDVWLESVQQITRQSEYIGWIPCAGGTALFFYKEIS